MIHQSLQDSDNEPERKKICREQSCHIKAKEEEEKRSLFEGFVIVFILLKSSSLL